MNFVKFISRLLIGAILGGLSSFALAPAIAALKSDTQTAGALLYLAMALGALTGVFARRNRDAAGRGLLLLGGCIVVLPISMTVLAGGVVAENISHSSGTAAELLGSAIGGILLVVLAGVVGSLGFVIMWVGLIVMFGRTRVMYSAKQAFAFIRIERSVD